MRLNKELGDIGPLTATRAVGSRLSMDLDEALVDMVELEGTDVMPSVTYLDVDELQDDLTRLNPALGVAAMNARILLERSTNDDKEVRDAFAAGMLVGFLSLNLIPSEE